MHGVFSFSFFCFDRNTSQEGANEFGFLKKTLAVKGVHLSHLRTRGGTFLQKLIMTNSVLDWSQGVSLPLHCKVFNQGVCHYVSLL